MAADTRVSITVDTGNAESNISRLRSAFDNLDRSTDNASRGIDDVARSADSAGRHLNNAETQSSRLSRAFSSIAKVGAVALGALSGAAVGVGYGIVETQREFDKLNAQLVTATGSTENAAKAFKELQAFAKTTPYDLAQSVEGFAKLKNLGLDPSIDSLRSFGNTSAAMGKDLNQMIEAVADATTGEFERLKEFGIKAKKEGDQVAFTFQGVTTKVGNNAKEIQQYLLDIGNTKFAGAMDARAQSLDGAIASLADSWKQLLLTVSQGGVGDAIAGVVRNIGDALDGITQKLQQPENVQMFKDALDGIGRAFGVIGGVIGAVVDGFSAIYDVVSANPDIFISVASGLTAVATAIGLISLYSAVPAIITAISGAMTMLGGAMTIALGPVGLIVMAIGALVAAGVYLYRNWDTVEAKATEIWGSISTYIGNAVKSITDWFSNAGQEIQNEFNVIGNGVKSAMSAISSTVSSVWNGLKSIVSSAMSAVSSTVSSAWNGIKNVVSSAINAIKSVVSAGLSLLSSVFSTQFGIIKTVVSTVMNAIKALVQGDIQGVKNAFSSGFSAIIGIVKTAVSNIISAFGNLGSQLFTIGVQAVQGLANGIKSRISAVGAEARNLASNVANSIRSVLDINSPSRVTHALGEHAGQGLANGLKAKDKEVEQASKQLADTVKNTLDELDKQRFMIANHNDPLADIKYRLNKGDLAGANALDKANILQTAKDNQWLEGILKAQNDSVSAFRQLQNQQSQDAYNNLSPADKLEADYQKQLEVITRYEAMIGQATTESQNAINTATSEYLAKKRQMTEAGYQSTFDSAVGLLGVFAGKQSRIYQTMLMASKIYAMRETLMNSWVAISKAWASAPFPANLPAVGIATAKTGVIPMIIQAISPTIGQAHDGIMSVPKSGTWNLEKGERVLPKHTAAAMDKTLANASGGNVQVNNYAGVAVTAKQENGLTIIDVRNEIERKMRSDLTNPNSNISKSIYRNTTANPQR